MAHGLNTICNYNLIYTINQSPFIKQPHPKRQRIWSHVFFTFSSFPSVYIFDSPHIRASFSSIRLRGSLIAVSLHKTYSWRQRSSCQQVLMMPGNGRRSDQHVVNGNRGARCLLWQRQKRQNLPEMLCPPREVEGCHFMDKEKLSAFWSLLLGNTRPWPTLSTCN